MKLPEHYLMTVVLHTAVLSAAVLVATLCFRSPQRVATTSLCGILAIAILPWFSAMRLAGRNSDPIEEGGSATLVSLPQWTVMTIPAGEAEAGPDAIPASFVALEGFTLALGIWLLGALISSALLFAAAGKIRRWRRGLAMPDDEAWQAILGASPENPDRRRFRIAPVDCSPCVAGFLRPLVVIPGFLLDPSMRRELGWALRHEMSHCRGHDSRWIIVLEWTRAIQWWNPFLHLLVSRWSMAREHVCDLAASEGDRPAYGEFLIEMAAKPTSRNPFAVTMVRSHRLKTLKARIVTVLKAAPGGPVRLERKVLFPVCLAMLGASLMISCVRIGEDHRDTTAASTPEKATRTSTSSDTLPAGKAAQIKINVKVLAPSDGPAAADGSIFTDAEMQQLMRTYAQKRGTMLMTMPSVTAKTGETAFLEIVREHPDDPPWSIDLKRPQARPNRFVGWSLRITPALDGGKVKVSADINYGFIPRAHYSMNTPSDGMFDNESKINWKKLQRKVARGIGRLSPGETVAINLGEVESRCFPTIFITAVPIDAVGREIKDLR
ncbi:M56 family metallopeptidase [Luteolibacter flavescens]|uniref:M56 family metallopeptidase n=1 Tax=Luteolibacter flavescens TaxID=1859460 RepID=A0ABT3FLI1_9BACT|nr:M56 family metallopeptidase [Luteolibacter flavescens]MCW1884413.1 M56 family metallopeptidase [Luteolibacter flavescens]